LAEQHGSCCGDTARRKESKQKRREMTELLRFIVDMRETVSGGMAGIAASAKRHLGYVDMQLRHTQNQFNVAGRSITDLNTRLNLLTQKRDLLIDTRDIARANREIQQLETRIRSMQGAGVSGSGSGSGSGFWKMAGAMGMGSLVAGGAMALGSMALGQGKEVLGSGMQGSMVRSQYETLNGQQAGGKLYEGLTKYIQDSIFGNELYKNATVMNQFGFNAGEILPELKRLGDVSMGNKEYLGGLSLVHSQVKAQGKLQGQDYHQYINNGWNPLKAISEQTGRTMDSLTKDMSEGKISFAMVSEALRKVTDEGGRYHNMLNKIGQTPYGKAQALQGNIDNAMLQLGTALLPAVSSFLDAVKPMIDGLPAFMEKIAPYGERMMAGLSDMLPEIVKTGQSVASALQPIIDLALSDQMRQLSTEVLGVIGKLAELSKGPLEIFADTLTKTVDTLSKSVAIINVGIEWLQKNLDKAGVDEKTWQAVMEAAWRATPLGQASTIVNSVYGMLPQNQYAKMAGTGIAGHYDPLTFKFIKDVAKWSPYADGRELSQPKRDSPSIKPQDTTSEITGGGARSITINVNKPLVTQDIHVNSASEVAEVGLHAFEEALLRTTAAIAERS
jgi:tape measure domain-containing protein